MYSINDLFRTYDSTTRHRITNGKYAFIEMDYDKTMNINRLNDAVEAYSFTLVRKGRMVIQSGKNTLLFEPDDVYVYVPGFSLCIVSVTDDYEGLCLIADEQTTHGITAFRDWLKVSYFPFMQIGGPKVHLDAGQVDRVMRMMRLMSDVIPQPTPLSHAILASLYSAFILQMTEISGALGNLPQVSSRKYDIFVSFYTLMRRFYLLHHDVNFYADALHITPIYLSRIIKEITGRTVIACIDTMIAAEASWLLATSQLSIAQIADRLRFSSPASFVKFFVRMMGLPPGAYRKGTHAKGS